MEALDQSEVDALVASASEGMDETAAPGERGAVRTPSEWPAADGRDTAPSAGSVRNQRSGATPPESLRLLIAPGTLKRLANVRVPVLVRLAERLMSIEQVLNVTVGTIIEFEKSAEADLDLVVNNVPIGTGNAVKCGENFGLRVISIQPWAERLAAMELEGRL